MELTISAISHVENEIHERPKWDCQDIRHNRKGLFKSISRFYWNFHRILSRFTISRLIEF
jgi:hypothetical protein